MFLLTGILGEFKFNSPKHIVTFLFGILGRNNWKPAFFAVKCNFKKW